MMQRVLLIVLLAAVAMMGSAVAQGTGGDPHEIDLGGSSLPPSAEPSRPSAIVGNEFAVASATGETWPAPVGDHFHSDDSGAFGNPTDAAETGGFSGMGPLEEVRGLGEFELSGQGTVPSMTLYITVIQLGGLFGQEPGVFDIAVRAYDGNNVEEIADYSASASNVATFNTAGLQLDQVLSFDITDAYNSAISRNVPSLGVRLQAVTDPVNFAFVFGEFELAPEGVSTTPRWSLVALLGLLLVIGLHILRRRIVSNT